MLRLNLVSILFFLSQTLWSQSDAINKIKLSLGARIATENVYRGAPLWPSPFMMLGVLINVTERISIVGPRLNVDWFPKDSSWELKSSMMFVDDNKPLFALNDHNVDYRNQRPSSLDWETRLSYRTGYRKKFFIGGAFSQELIRYWGMHADVKVGVPVLPFTQVSYELGWGPKKTLQYLYGPDARGGFSYQQWSLNVVLPFLPWKGVWIHQLALSDIIYDSNARASFVKQDDTNFVYSSFITWQFY